MELLCDRIVDRMVTYSLIPLEDKPFYSYELQVLLESIIAHFSIMLLALLCGYFLEVFLFTLSFSLLRMHTGGFHCKTNIGCIIMSIATCTLVVYVCLMAEHHYWIITLMVLGAAIVIFVVGTVNNSKLDLSHDEYVETARASRKWLQVLIIGLVLLRLLNVGSYYISFVEMGFVVCAASMILAKITMKGGGCYEEDRT